jgi:hypothetical protein
MKHPELDRMGSIMSSMKNLHVAFSDKRAEVGLYKLS